MARRERPSTDSPVADPAPIEVLIVDDSALVRQRLKSIIESDTQFRVVLAADPYEAVAMLSKSVPGVIVLDVEMPRMDGFGLTEAIRAHASLANVPVLILTSRSTDADRLRGLEAGADGYIVKSAFDERGLLTAIGRLLGNRT